MILIDAVKLKKDLPKYADYFEALAWIDEAEEVEAIPIDWISKYTCGEITSADYWAIVRMYRAWRKENETN